MSAAPTSSGPAAASSPPRGGPASAGGGPSLGNLRVRVERLAGLPLVSARCWLLGGSRLEPVPGLSLLTGRMLGEGTLDRSWDRLATEVEDRGMLLQTHGTAESVGAALEGLSEDRHRVLDWLAEILERPAFARDRLDWTRRQTVAELESLLDQPDYRTIRAFLEHMYPDHPYGRPLQGDGESLAAIGPDDCRDFLDSARAWGGVLVVTGDLDEAETLARIEERFAGFAERPTRAAPVPLLAPAPSTFTATDEAASGAGDRRVEVPVGGDADQAHLYMGHPTVARTHADRIALDVAATLMGAGAGTAGRLPVRVREKEGLAYSVDISFAASAGLEPGRLVAYVGTSPDRLPRAERAVREELERLVDEGPTEREVDEAKSFLLGREPFRRETLRQRADLLAEAEIYGLPVDQPGWLAARLAELDRAQVLDAVRRWVRPDRLLTTIGRPD